MTSFNLKSVGNALFNFFANFFNMFSKVNMTYVISGLVLLLALLFILYYRQRKINEKLQGEAHLTNFILHNFRPDRGLEKNLNELLELISTYIASSGYYFYLLDQKNNQYVLKTVRHSEITDGQIAPSYSGLLPYNKEKYLPPLSLALDSLPSKTCMIKEGAVPLLVIPITGGKGLVRVGPLDRIPKKMKDKLDLLGEKFASALDILLETVNLKNQVEVIVSSSRAMQNISTATMDYKGTLHTIMGLSIRMIGASGGCFLLKDNKQYRIEVTMGLEKSSEDRFRSDQEGHYRLGELARNHDFLLIKRGDENFYQIPSSLVATGVSMIMLNSVATAKSIGTVAYWFPDPVRIEEHRINGLMMLTKRLGDILDSHSRFQELSDSYIDILKMLVQIMDNLEPHTVGYSVMMSRYAGIVAREMKLSEREIQDISLAAYLSNIGVLGLSSDLLFKHGKYTELEYETMKLHADVGASIIEATLGNSNLAKYIRHHHERMDGYGYPSGLKGQEIPVGSRIIGVLQTFMAKINGRKYRDSLPFEQAISILRTAGGSQLDTQIVEILINWFNKKRSSPARQGRSLGPCWEMRCSPDNVCMVCPAYRNMERNCWEYEGTNCSAHGNKCESCFIYTETVSRISKKIASR